VGRPGHEGEEARRGKGAGQALEHADLAFGGQLGPHHRQVAEVETLGFREGFQERGFP